MIYLQPAISQLLANRMSDERPQDDGSVGSGGSRNRNRSRNRGSDGGRRNRGRDGGRRDKEDQVFTPRSYARDRNDWKEDETNDRNDRNDDRGGGRVVLRSAWDNPYVNHAYNNDYRGGSFGFHGVRDSSHNRDDLLRFRKYSSRPQFFNNEKEDAWDQRLFKENVEATQGYKICSLRSVCSFYYFLFFLFFMCANG